MTNDIIPFGKYRGQEIEQIRQRDPAYLQWLTQQAWFSEKFAPVYQLVVNNFAPPSEETPAHNALQVRFLDFDFQVAFWYASGADETMDWENLVVRFNNRRSELRKAPKPFDRRNINHPYEKQRLEWHRAAVKKKWETWRLRNQQPKRMRTFASARFEGVSDVVFTLTAAIGFGNDKLVEFDVGLDVTVYVEIKPSMGDDYPAVLRQIKRQQQQAERTYNTGWFLLIDQFASQAVTLEQVSKIFRRDRIMIVMMQDVRERLIKRQGTD